MAGQLGRFNPIRFKHGMSPLETSWVSASVANVIHAFHQTPNMFLTEEDLRVHLCRFLFDHFADKQRTLDEDVSIPLHTEVRWYGDGKLKIRSDIVLVDVSNLKVLKHSKLPTKGFGFNIPKAIIELKFRRPNGVADSRFLKNIRVDLRKLEKLREVFLRAEGPSNPKFWMVIFDKKSRMPAPPEAPYWINLAYEFSNQTVQV
jgi:hypothetical protein